MAFPTTAILDDFNRADQNPIAGIWTAFTGLGAMKVLSNQMAITNAGYVFCGNFIGNDYIDSEAYVTWSTLDGAVATQLLLRITDSSTSSFTTIGDTTKNGYQAEIGGTGTCNIYRLDSSALTVISSFSITALSAGDKVGFRATGPTLTVWVKYGAAAWAQQGTATSSTYTHGAIGILTNSPVVRYDDFGGGTSTDNMASIAWLHA